jgi:uncharacterized membrane protein
MEAQWQSGRREAPQRLTRGLGWLSLSLGAASMMAPRRVARMIGADDDRSTRTALLACGAREIATGLGLLGRRRTAPWLWMRVGGDLIDLALLGMAFRKRRSNGRELALASAFVLGVTLVDVMAARSSVRVETGRKRVARRAPAQVTQSITINRAPEDVYAFWRDFASFPRFMKYVESVDAIDDRRSHWTVRMPGGVKLEWDAEIVEDLPSSAIAWRSLPNADIDNAGVVELRPAPGGRGTEVHLRVGWAPRGGSVGRTVARLFNAVPKGIARADLRRLKQVLETGGVVTAGTEESR